MRGICVDLVSSGKQVYDVCKFTLTGDEEQKMWMFGEHALDRVDMK